MSSLSFVALSMQTTHLDPATVSQAAYLKMVDGQITRLENISIIPPTSDAGAETPVNAVSWSEALSQLGMVVGKLPLISYYRDADKEIFQAASRRSGIELPHFHWLDCRALARELLPDLPDHQPSTVLKALNLYDERAADSTVEQTAQIVLQLAEDRGATTLNELWGELYDQPDDLLDLGATLNGLSSPEPDPSTEAVDRDHESIEASVLPTFGAEHEPLPPRLWSPESADVLAPDELAAETRLTAEYTGDTEPRSAAIGVDPGVSVEASSEPTGSRQYPDSQIPADEAAGEVGEASIEDLSDSPAQSVIARENLEQPEFLKVSDTEEPHHEELSKQQDTATASEPMSEASETEQVVPAADPIEEVIGEEHVETPAPQSHPAVDEPSETDRQEVTETTPPTATAKDLVEPDSPPSSVEEARKTSARTGRVWGMVGMIVFGLLTLVGAILTVMATLAFFTANNILMETKVTGVVLTSAIALLSLLMATMSYRMYRRK